MGVRAVGAVGLLVCYAFGTAWFLIVYTRTGAITLGVVLAKCVLPFLLPDAVKLALATLLRARLYRRIPHKRRKAFCRPANPFVKMDPFFDSLKNAHGKSHERFL